LPREKKFPATGRLNVLAKLKIIDYLHGAMCLQQPTGSACEENIRLSCEQKVQTLFSLSLSVNSQVYFFKPNT
jgi:hypothetical protein